MLGLLSVPCICLFLCIWYCFLELLQSFRPYIKPFDNFELILVQGERQGSSLNLLHVDIQFSQPRLLKRLFLLHYVFWAALSKISLICVWLFYSDPLVSLSVFVQYHAVLLLWLCRYSLEFRYCDASSIGIVFG
jgi:hypothetical protein